MRPRLGAAMLLALATACSGAAPGELGRAAAEAGAAPETADGWLGYGVWARFPAASAVPSPGAEERCGAALCAGLGKRPLHPAFLPLEERPTNAALRLVAGTDGYPLGGYGARLSLNPFRYVVRSLFEESFYTHVFRASHGTEDPSRVTDVRALVLVDAGGRSLLWLRADLVGIAMDQRQALVAELRRRGHGWVHDGNLLLHATHTHSGFGGLSPRGTATLGMDSFSPAIFEAAVEAMADAVDAAVADLGAARIGVGRGEIRGIGMNRRWTCAREGDAPNTDPDPSVGVLRVDRADGSPLATVFHHGIHGVSLPETNMGFSPDNSGWAEARVAAAGAGVGLFLNGSEGDVNPTGGPAQVGLALGTEVARVWAGIETTPRARLSAAFCRNDDPENEPSYDSPCGGVFDFAQLRIRKSMPDGDGEDCFQDRGLSREDGMLELTYAKEDDILSLEREGVLFGAFGIELDHGDRVERLALATVPGEPITDIGYAIKRPLLESGELDHVWVVGLANAHVGYVVTEEELRQSGYESALNVFGPDEGRIVVDNARSLVESLPW